MLLPSCPNPDLCEVYPELSHTFRYIPGFPASATYDGSHSIEAGYVKLSREKTLSRYHRETSAKPSVFARMCM